VIITDPHAVRIIASLTIAFLAISGVVLVRMCTERFEKVGYTVIFALSITSIFTKVFC
jgi:hypothetical protein